MYGLSTHICTEMYLHSAELNVVAVTENVNILSYWYERT